MAKTSAGSDKKSSSSGRGAAPGGKAGRRSSGSPKNTNTPKRISQERGKAAPKKGANRGKAAPRGSKHQQATWKSRFWPFFWKLSLVFGVVLVVGLAYLDALVRDRFEGKRWALPAKVYARPLELYPGQALSAEDLKLELDSLGYRFVSQADRPGTAEWSASRVTLHTRGFEFPDALEPAQRLRLSFGAEGLRRVTDERGRELALSRLEPVLVGGIYTADREDRELMQLAEAPPYLLDALTQVEDRDFYQHTGVSLKGIARAFWANLQAGRVVQGGSTLTQQLVKNFYLTQERSLGRKLLELPMALLLELHYDKPEILEAYLNEVYLGQAGSRAIHGFGLASQYYFAQPIQELELHQVSLLVGLVKGPSYYDPRRNPQRALERRNLVIRVLEEQGKITPEQAQRAQAKPLGVVASQQLIKGTFPAYLDLVKRQLRKDYLEEDLNSEGLRVFTNLDPILQRKAEQSLVRVTKGLAQRHGQQLESLQGAMVVGNIQNGEVLAVIGGRDTRYQGFNRALDAVRPIGSLVKPAVYLTALEQGYTLSSLLDDSPVQVSNPDGSLWEPRNFDRESHGTVPLHQALSRSYNQSTARLGMQLGMHQILATLRKLGIERSVPPYPSTLLGAAALSPLEVAGMYQTIAAGGFRTPLRAIRSVATATGEPLSRYGLEVEQAFSPESMHLLQYALQETAREGTAKSIYRTLPSSLNVAGKTGTTNDQRDSWFAGFSGDLLSVVWLGLDDNSPMPLTGSSGALPVWSDFMLRSGVSGLNVQLPENIRYQWVDEATGLRTDEGCEGARLIPFVAGTEPVQEVRCATIDPIKRSLRWIKGWFDQP